MDHFSEVEIADVGKFAYVQPRDGGKEPVLDVVNFPLFIIRQAWRRGMGVEDLADGFGPGAGTHGDWSGIRDSTHGALEAMLQRALNYLFHNVEEN